MKSVQTLFGEISYDPRHVVHFPEGLIGFEHLRDFVVMPHKHDDFLYCFQNVEENHVVFLLVNPSLFFPDYSVPVGSVVKKKLGAADVDPFFIFTTITFHQNEDVTLNLMAPIVYCPKTDRAVQIVLDKGGYSTRAALPPQSKPV
jgi:flagellar assembly factor FliW